MSESAESATERWRAMLLGNDPAMAKWRRTRRFFRAIPRSPRCKTCAAPFAGPFRPLFRLLGKEPFAKNPHYCRSCNEQLTRSQGGAEVPISMLFADVRGSTPLAERLGPVRLHELMSRFYGVGVEILTRRDALIERFMGDQVVGYFIPAFAGADHARDALDAGRELLQATGNVPGQEPWVPIGIGVHTGDAFVGTVGSGDMLEFTALGENVNLAARLGSAAGAGEMLASDATATAAGVGADAERRDLELKGVTERMSVRVLHA